MQIVIDIPEESYNAICTITTLAEMESISQDTKRVVYTGIQNGIILPKGHGKLINVDELLTSERPRGITDDIWKESHIYKLLSNAPTIIKADKEN